MLQRHDPDGMRVDVGGHRHYRIPDHDRPVPSVTTVLAQTLGSDDGWAFKVWRDRLEHAQEGASEIARDVAAARGTRLHAYATDVLTGARKLAGPERDAWQSSIDPLLRQWQALAQLELADGAVWHGFDLYGGTVDFVLQLAGLRVFDLKTAAKPRTRQQLERGIAQLGGYIEAIRWVYCRDCRGAGLAVALPDRPAQVVDVKPAEAVELWTERLRRFKLHDRR